MNNFDTDATYFESNQQYHPTNADVSKVICEDQYQIERLATQYKNLGDWDGALACLHYIKTELEQMGDPHYFGIALRLALYLQAAGRFEEAKFELQSLFDEVDNVVEFKVGHHREKSYFEHYIEWARYLEFHRIFDTARKIYKREKLNAEAADFEKKAKLFWDISREHHRYIDEHEKNLLDKIRSERELNRKLRLMEEEKEYSTK
ncbi:hypothetical protein [Frederiksenia canicola]